jgi:hypothetical protein
MASWLLISLLTQDGPFLDNTKVIPDVTTKNTENMGQCICSQQPTIQEHGPAESSWQIENSTHALGGLISCLGGQEEYGGCIPSTYDIYIGGITGMYQISGLLLSWSLIPIANRDL